MFFSCCVIRHLSVPSRFHCDNDLDMSKLLGRNTTSYHLSSTDIKQEWIFPQKYLQTMGYFDLEEHRSRRGLAEEMLLDFFVIEFIGCPPLDPDTVGSTSDEVGSSSRVKNTNLLSSIRESTIPNRRKQHLGSGFGLRELILKKEAWTASGASIIEQDRHRVICSPRIAVFDLGFDWFLNTASLAVTLSFQNLFLAKTCLYAGAESLMRATVISSIEIVFGYWIEDSESGGKRRFEFDLSPSEVDIQNLAWLILPLPDWDTYSLNVVYVLATSEDIAGVLSSLYLDHLVKGIIACIELMHILKTVMRASLRDL
ncbi:hypothetical protein Tco_1465400 [Tanacetum coccineum]